jgi:hypothetical protein
LTCLAWEALPVAYATASIALGIMWPHKPHHYVKVRIPSGGVSLINILKLMKQQRLYNNKIEIGNAEGYFDWQKYFSKACLVKDRIVN